MFSMYKLKSNTILTEMRKLFDERNNFTDQTFNGSIQYVTGSDIRCYGHFSVATKKSNEVSFPAYFPETITLL